MRASRVVSVAAGLIAAVVLSGCFQLPLPAPAPAPTSAAPQQPESPAPVAGGSDAETAAEPMFDSVADSGLGTVWSFEPTRIVVVPTDERGIAPEPGFKLVVIHMDGQLISGEGNFYFDFRVKLVDTRNGDLWGLSSGTNYNAPNDLYWAGDGQSFTDAQAMFAVPVDVELGQAYFVMNDTGETWTFTLPVEGE